MVLIILLLLSMMDLTGAERQVRVWVTAYCPCEKCCGVATGITSTGKRVDGEFHTSGGTPQYGIAADPRAVPYGSLIRFEGYKPSRYYPADYAWPVDDTGGAMRRAWDRGVIHLDFRFRNHNSALRWAARHGGWQTVVIITPVPERTDDHDS